MALIVITSNVVAVSIGTATRLALDPSAAALAVRLCAARALWSIGIASAALAMAGDGWISTGISVRMLVAKGE